MGGSRIRPDPPFKYRGERVQATNSVGAWIDSAPPENTTIPDPQQYYYDANTMRVTAIKDSAHLIMNPPLIVKDDESRN